MSAPYLLATTSDLGDFVGVHIDDNDKQATAVLGMVSAFIRAETKQPFDDGAEVPDAAKMVAVDIAARMWRNPEGLVQDDVDDSRKGWSERAAEGMYLTAANRAMLDSLRAPSFGGLGTIRTTRDDAYADTVYVPTGPPPSGDPFPWYDGDDPRVWR